MESSNIIIKIADRPSEFEQIHTLNYQTFVEELQQHSKETCESERLVDKFHAENTYIIAVKDNEILGMMAYRGVRPFSLDSKLENLDQYLPFYYYPCEIRLLSVKAPYRHSRVLFNLANSALEFIIAHGHDCVVVSAYEKEKKLYRHLGFEEMAYSIKSGASHFQPMFTDLIRCKYKKKYNADVSSVSKAYLIPGPVRSFNGVDDAYCQPPISHRSSEFFQLFQETRELLVNLVNAKHVQIATGGGTLANDMIAWQLALCNEEGLVLANGEFGNRLIQHAKRAGLNFRTLQKEWGEKFSAQEIHSILLNFPNIKWLWAVHCETSTGMLNNLALLNEISRTHRIKLVLDCVSSIGTLPLDLSTVFLASGSSAKGLGAKAGLAFVFHNQEFAPAPDKLPTVLDLGYYAAHNGIPFTLPSSLIAALRKALEWTKNFKLWLQTKQYATRIRNALKDEDIPVLVDASDSSPAIVTVVLAKTVDTMTVGNKFAEQGIFLHYHNRYLLERNWIQIALMGRFSYEDIIRLLDNVFLFKG